MQEMLWALPAGNVGVETWSSAREIRISERGLDSYTLNYPRRQGWLMEAKPCVIVL